jgi:hypothetical protein
MTSIRLLTGVAGEDVMFGVAMISGTRLPCNRCFSAGLAAEVRLADWDVDGGTVSLIFPGTASGVAADPVIRRVERRTKPVGEGGAGALDLPRGAGGGVGSGGGGGGSPVSAVRRRDALCCNGNGEERTGAGSRWGRGADGGAETTGGG